MFTIIKHIPRKLTIDELADALQPFVSKGIFKKRSELKALKFMDLVDHDGVLVERHAIIRTNGEDIQQKLIQAINTKRIKLLRQVSEHGETKCWPCWAEPFVVRWHGNDRRQKSSSSIGLRKTERRRYELTSFISYEKDS